jgi:muramoyltetrapeptide carboxypeptidase
MRVVKPKKLEKGDMIGIISPASSPDDLSKIERGAAYLEKLGYHVLIGKNTGKYHGYLAGTDIERADDLISMFKNKSVKAIFCTRGGYGTPRLLDKIDYNAIKNNPKIFAGYSDITALQMAIFKKTGLVTFAGPMVASDMSGEIDSYAEESFWQILTNNKETRKIVQPDGNKISGLTKGTAKGRIIGGNLAILTSIAGTSYFPDLKEKILFLEEVCEAPYRVDRMLNQLRLLKVFKSVKGVILGAFTECSESNTNKRTLTLGEVMQDYLSGLKIPVVYNFPHGHIKSKITIPYGINVSVNASRSTVEYLESAVH